MEEYAIKDDFKYFFLEWAKTWFSSMAEVNTIYTDFN
jgi:hypothetical protein